VPKSLEKMGKKGIMESRTTTRQARHARLGEHDHLTQQHSITASERGKSRRNERRVDERRVERRKK
jgi:hypothetical protein